MRRNLLHSASLAGKSKRRARSRRGACRSVERDTCDAMRCAGLVTIHNAETGFSLRELPRETLRSLGLPYGLAVVRTGGVAQRAGLRIGDVVFGLNHRQVRSLEEFNRLLAPRAQRLLRLGGPRGRRAARRAESGAA
jgi:hypothetical protein